MPNVKRGASPKGPTSDRTTVSSKHQVTIPKGAFRRAGLEPGDRLTVEAEGSGRIVLTRMDELLDRFSGCIDSGGQLRQQIDELVGEWR